MTESLLDTSVLIGGSDQPLPGDQATRAAISVVTLGELRAGVLLAAEAASRAARAQRLARIRAALLALPVDDAVADQYGVALAHARQRRRVTKATDLLIIATAAATGRLLMTHDRSQAALARELDLPVSVPD
ncbi:MAG: PIN domain-containing protein [Thermoleophilaceae bacterium]